MRSTTLKVERTAGEMWGFGHYVGTRFWRDHGFTKSAALSYDLLFALIPVVALAFGILTAFPGFDEMRSGLQSYLIRSFLPEQGDEIGALLDNLISNARGLAAFSVIAITFTALLLFDTVDSVFNDIWRQTAVRPLIARLGIFWAIITLLPLLIGGSIALSTVVARHGVTLGIDFPWLTDIIVWIAPITLLTVAFAAGFYALPYRRLRLIHALVGGLVSALLLQALRWIFIWFIDAVPTLWKTYGLLASIPISLLWLFLFWSIILIGAEITAAIPEWRQRPGAGASTAPLPVRRLVAALLMIDQLIEGRRTGISVSEEQLREAAVNSLARIDRRTPQAIIDQLASERIVAPTGKGWQLARDPSEVTIAQIMGALDLGYGSGATLDFLKTPWGPQLASVLTNADTAAQQALSLDIESLLARSGVPTAAGAVFE
jgi:membrane protein